MIEQVLGGFIGSWGAEGVKVDLNDVC